MRWSDGRRSDNVEDRRGMGGPVLAGGVGILGIILALVVALLGEIPLWCCNNSVEAASAWGCPCLDEPSPPADAGG